MWKSNHLLISSDFLCIFAWMHRLHWDVRDTNSLLFFKVEQRNISIDLELLWLLSEWNLIPLQDSYFENEARAYACQFAKDSLKSSWVIVEVLRVWYVLHVSMWYMHYNVIFTFCYLLCWNSLLIHNIMSQLLINPLLRAVTHTGSIDMWAIIWITHMNYFLKINVTDS